MIDRMGVLRIGTTVYDLTDESVDYIATLSTRREHLHRRKNAVPFLRFGSFSSAHGLEIGWRIENTTTMAILRALRDHAGTVDVWYKRGGQAFRGGLTDRTAVREIALAGTRRRDDLSMTLEGRWWGEVCPYTWEREGSLASDLKHVSGAAAVKVLVVDQYTGETLGEVWFDIDEIPGGLEVSSWIDSVLHSDQLRSLWDVREVCEGLPVLTGELIPQYSSTWDKLIWLSETERELQVTLWPGAVDERTIWCIMPPRKRIEYRYGYPSATLQGVEPDSGVELLFLAVEHGDGAHPVSVELSIDTANEWRGVGSLGVSMEEAVPQEGAGGGDDPTGVLSIGARFATDVAEWEDGRLDAEQICRLVGSHNGRTLALAGAESGPSNGTFYDLDPESGWTPILALCYNTISKNHPAVLNDETLGVIMLPEKDSAGGRILCATWSGTAWTLTWALGGVSTGDATKIPRSIRRFSGDGLIYIAGAKTSGGYYGTWIPVVWTFDGTTLTEVWSGTSGTFGTSALGLVEYDGVLYVGEWVAGVSTKIYSSPDGAVWSLVHTAVGGVAGSATWANTIAMGVSTPSRVGWIGDYILYSLNGSAFTEVLLTGSARGAVVDCDGTLERPFAVSDGGGGGEYPILRINAGWTAVDTVSSQWCRGLYCGSSFLPGVGYLIGGQRAAGTGAWYGILQTRLDAGSYERTDDAGRQVSWRNVSIVQTLEGGTMTVLVAAADDLSLLPSGSNGYPYALVEITAGAGLCNVIGRYLKRRLVWEDCGEGAEIDTLVVGGVAS